MKSLIFIFKQSSIIFIEIKKKYAAPRRHTQTHSLASSKKSPAIQRDKKIQATMKSRQKIRSQFNLTYNYKDIQISRTKSIKTGFHISKVSEIQKYGKRCKLDFQR